ncbi:MAG: hypothetical protein QW303_06450 [Nitrososphaerota archaeon]
MEKSEFKFRKIFAMIPVSLYEELVKKNKFNSDWDLWLAIAIKKKLEEERE